MTNTVETENCSPQLWENIELDIFTIENDKKLIASWTGWRPNHQKNNQTVVGI